MDKTKLAAEIGDLSYDELKGYIGKQFKVAPPVPTHVFNKRKSISLLESACRTFTGNDYTTLVYDHTNSNADLFNMANYITAVLGEYNFYTSKTCVMYVCQKP